MKYRKWIAQTSCCALTIAIATLFSHPTFAAWSDDFDSYETGSTLIGQGAWAGWQLAGPGENDSVVTDERAFSGEHSLLMGGSPYVDLIPQFEGATSGIWSVKAMSYVPEDSNDGMTDIGFLSRHLGFQDATDTQWFGAFRLHMANDLAGDLDGNTEILRDEWIQIEAVFDIDAREYELFYDGEFMSSGTWSGDYALVGLDVWSEDGASPMYYDDFVVAPVIEGSVGDFNNDGTLDVADLDLLLAEVRATSPDLLFDVTEDQLVDFADVEFYVSDETLLNTYVGDANLDGQFNSSDFVTVFTAGEYEDAILLNSTWATGDWNGDGEFNSSDFVSAFSSGGYEQGVRASTSAVPEPNSILLLLIGLAATSAQRPHSRNT